MAVIGVIVSAAIPPFLVGALAPLIARDMPFGAGDLGLAIAAYYLVSGLLSPTGGWIVERIGVRWSLRLSCGITTVGLVAIAAAESAVHIAVALAFLGLPNSAVQPAANAVLAEVEAPRLRAFVFGVVQAAIPAATLVAGVVLGVASYLGGWRWTILTVAGLTVVALWMLRVLGAGTPTPATGGSPVDLPPDRDRPHRPVGGPWAMVALVCTGFLGSTAATTLPAYVASSGLDTGLAPGVVAAAQVAGSLACAGTRIVASFGVTGDRAGKRLLFISGLLVVGVVGYVCLWTGTTVGFFLGTVVAYAFGWGWNGLFNLVVVNIRPEAIASATGKTQGGVFLGGMFGPLLFAAVVSHSGFGSAWLVAAGAALGAAVAAGSATVVLRRDRAA